MKERAPGVPAGPPNCFPDLALALGGPLAVTGVVAFLDALTGVPALLLYGVAVTLAARAGGLLCALLSGSLAFVLANVTFIEPVGALTVEARILPLALLCVVSVAVGLGAREVGTRG